VRRLGGGMGSSRSRMEMLPIMRPRRLLERGLRGYGWKRSIAWACLFHTATTLGPCFYDTPSACDAAQTNALFHWIPRLWSAARQPE
jgi:hypothetical protein